MSAEDFLPQNPRSVRALRHAAEQCRGCDLYARATQTVFGQGRARAALMVVGEQPGDVEDQVGEPFVGPAGRLLDQALEQVGLQRRQLYITNAVKHFKWEGRGKLRLHKNPSAREVAACRPWLRAEMAAVAPEVVLCLGATAARALLGPSFRVTRQRGEFYAVEGCSVMATVHPAAIVRIRQADERKRAFDAFVVDLKVAARRAGL